MNRPLLVGALLAACSGPALAGDHSLGLKMGSLGLGVEYAYDVTERWSVRAGLNGANVGFDGEESGIDYEFDFVWDSAALSVDLHPAKGPFRLTAGLLRNDNRLDGVSRPSANVLIGDTTYTPAQVGTLTSRIGFDKSATYFALGFDRSRKTKDKRFGLTTEFGVVDQGSPIVSLRGSGTLLGNPAFEQDIAAERAELQGELEDLDLLPYVNVGFVFRF